MVNIFTAFSLDEIWDLTTSYVTTVFCRSETSKVMFGFSQVNSCRNKFIYIQIILNYIDLYVNLILLFLNYKHDYNNRNTRISYKVYSKLTIKTKWTYYRSSVSLVNFEHVNGDVFAWFKSTDFDIRTNVHNSQELRQTAEANFSFDLCTVSGDIHHIIDITL